MVATVGKVGTGGVSDRPPELVPVLGVGTVATSTPGNGETGGVSDGPLAATCL